MKKNFEIIKNNPLFAGIEQGDYEKMLHCIEAWTHCYKKDEIIMLLGDTVSHVGLVLSGGVKIIKEDMDGQMTIIAALSVPELFGEVLACAEIVQSPVLVQASEQSEILFINYKRVINMCSSVCKFHTKLIENMLRLIAKKNLMLNQKIEILSKRTTRKKILTFFDAYRGSSKKFTVPFNREDMAHYLCVDRSAMSNELCKMRNEGLIRFNRNKFEIL